MNNDGESQTEYASTEEREGKIQADTHCDKPRVRVVVLETSAVEMDNS